MLLAAIAPEVILYFAADQFFEARYLLKNLIKKSSKEWTLTQTQFACAGGFWTRNSEGEEVKCSVEELWKYIENKRVDGPSISVEELQARGKSDLIIKLVAIFQIIWFVVQTLFRAIQHYQITALEIMTVAFVFCSLFVYGFAWYQPQDVVYPVFLEIRTVAPATDGADKSKQTGEGAHSPEKPAPSDTQMKYGSVPGLTTEVLPALLFGLFACGFGALHCLAWNSPFPTSKENLAWRICSVTTTVLPVASALLFALLLMIGWETLSFITMIAASGAYIMGRVTIIVLAFIALRALPADAFQTVNWNTYIPHFGA